MKGGSQNEMKTIMNNYMRDSKSKGAILFCVCRGKLSEGIDFSDEMARAVVVIGIPYPQAFDARVKSKKKHLDDRKARLRKVSIWSDFFLKK